MWYFVKMGFMLTVNQLDTNRADILWLNCFVILQYSKQLVSINMKYKFRIYTAVWENISDKLM